MAVFRWGQSWDPFHDLEREVDRLLAGVSWSFQQGLRFGRQFPPVNLYEVGEELVLTAELPGVRPEDLEISVDKGVLTIKGRRVGPDGIADDRYRRQERPRGNWQRSFSFPEPIQEERLAAEFTNGVLKIRMPRAPGSQPRQIPVVEGNA